VIQAFLFDLDGVLTDTSEYHYRSWKQLADEEGIPFNRTDNEALRGLSRRESLENMLKGRVIPEETAQAWMERKNRYYIEYISQMPASDLLPGAVELLDELRGAGIHTAIASGSKNAGLVLDRLQLWSKVDVVADGNTVTRSKPAPDLFLSAATKLGLQPAVCVVVEDAAAGVEAGKAAGMLTLGLGPVERVGQADMVLPSLEGAKLAEILSKLERKA
jgi:beta-phosphoglucomutase